MATTRTVLLGALAALSLTIGACGGSDDDDAAPDVTNADEEAAPEAGGDCAADGDLFDSVQDGTTSPEEQVTILEGLVARHDDIAEPLAILLDDRERIVAGDVPNPEVSLGDITDANVAIGDHFDGGC